MIGKLIGAFAGAEAAKRTSKIGGTGGAILGAVAVPFISRLRLPALLALGAGGYVASKLAEKGRKAEPTKPAGVA